MLASDSFPATPGLIRWIVGDSCPEEKVPTEGMRSRMPLGGCVRVK